MNLERWNRLATPPETALKKITGGRLAGKTDINPQWRYKAMTEEYGPCGEGWRYEITRLWTEPAPAGAVFAFSLVNVQVKTTVAAAGGVHSFEWSAPIPGIGGSMLVEQEKNGLYANDEAFKMATTDALSVALKMLGVGSNVYEGLVDGSKYAQAPRSAPAPAHDKAPAKIVPPVANGKAVTVVDCETKDGEGKRGPYTRYAVTFSDGVRAATFDEALGKRALAFAGSPTPVRYEITRNAKGYGNDLIDLGVPVANDDEPPPLTDDDLPF